jgi:hypothetical protein
MKLPVICLSLLTLLSCTQSTSSPGIISIHKDHYGIKLQGDSQTVHTKLELNSILQDKLNTTDSLYIQVMDSPAASLENLLTLLRDIKFSKYRVDVTQDYFRLPY